MDLSLVIVNRNTRAFLLPCLASVSRAIAGLHAEVIVVDERSADGSASAVQEQFPWVQLLLDGTDRGYAHANNIGLRGAHGRYLLTLNPDTIVPADALHRLVAWMDEHPHVGVVGPKLVRADGSLDLACRRSFPTPTSALYRYLGMARRFPNDRRFARYNLTYLDPDVAAEVDSVCGAFMLVRRTAAEQTRFFDEDYFMYGEDLDWAYRIKARGWQVFYEPSVVVLHYKGQASKQRSGRMIVEFHRAMWTFYRKHYAAQEPWFVTLLVSAGIVARGALTLVRNTLRPPTQRRVA